MTEQHPQPGHEAPCPSPTVVGETLGCGVISGVASGQLTTLTRNTLAVVTTVMVIVAILWTGSYLYDLLTLLGVCLVATYILLGPVHLMEQFIRFLLAKAKGLPYLSFFCFSSGNSLDSQHQSHHPGITPRLLSILLVYLAFLLVTTIAILVLLPAAGKQLRDLGHVLPSYIEKAEVSLIERSERWFGSSRVKEVFLPDIRAAQPNIHPPTQHIQPNAPLTKTEKQVISQSILRRALSPGIHYVTKRASNALTNVSGVFSSALQSLFFILMGIFLTFYFLRDGEKIQEQTLKLLPDGARKTTHFILKSTHQVMMAFIKGQILLGLLTGFYMFIIYSLFHVEYALLLGSFFAVSEILPVVGTWIGITPGIIVMLFSDDPWVTLWVWLCSYGYQTIKDNILAPKIVGDVMGLHPLTVLVSLLVFGKLAGLVGILLALPVVSLINVVIRFLLHDNSDDPTANNPSGTPVPEGIGP